MHPRPIREQILDANCPCLPPGLWLYARVTTELLSLVRGHLGPENDGWWLLRRAQYLILGGKFTEAQETLLPLVRLPRGDLADLATIEFARALARDHWDGTAWVDLLRGLYLRRQTLRPTARAWLLITIARMHRRLHKQEIKDFEPSALLDEAEQCLGEGSDSVSCLLLAQFLEARGRVQGRMDSVPSSTIDYLDNAQSLYEAQMPTGVHPGEAWVAYARAQIHEHHDWKSHAKRAELWGEAVSLHRRAFGVRHLETVMSTIRHLQAELNLDPSAGERSATLQEELTDLFEALRRHPEIGPDHPKTRWAEEALSKTRVPVEDSSLPVLVGAPPNTGPASVPEAAEPIEVPEE